MGLVGRGYLVTAERPYNGVSTVDALVQPDTEKDNLLQTRGPGTEKMTISPAEGVVSMALLVLGGYTCL